MNEIEVKLPNLHEGQKELVDGKKRFNVVPCGRRWGKTVVAGDLLLDEHDETNGAIHGHPVAYFTPTYGTLVEIWNWVKQTCHGLIKHKNEARHRLELITGGIVEMWSLDNIDSARGRKYKRIIIDEAAYVRDLENAWTKSLRPMLVDYKGDAFFFSTPNGKGNYFYEMSLFENEFDDWKTFSQPSWKNPYLPKEEIEDAKRQLVSDVFRQEFGAEFVEANKGNNFIYAFREEHIVQLKYVPNQDLIISFDFNVDPITAIACQHSIRRDDIRILKEFRIPNSDIYELCERIKTTFPDATYVVTGDASGKNRSALTRGNKTYYHIIKKQLRLGPRQIKLPSRNPSIANTRVLTNSMFANHDSFFIDESCEYLIKDIRSVVVDESGGIDKKQGHLTHLLDCLRYYLWNFHKDFIDV